MQINFTWRNLEATPALKSMTEEKLSRLQTRDHHINHINVTFQVEKTNQIAEATIHINGTDLHASATSTDMYSSLDLLIDKLMKQMTKHKEKNTDHR